MFRNSCILTIILCSFLPLAGFASPLTRTQLNDAPQERLAAVNQQLTEVETALQNQSPFEDGTIIPPEVVSKPKYVYAKKHSFDFGTEVYYYRYVEDIPIYIKGVMTGYYGNYTYRPEEGNILNNSFLDVYGLQGKYAWGDLNYKGSGKDKGGPNHMYEVRAITGKDYVLMDASRVTPYVGFGYRFLRDRGDDRSWPRDGGGTWVGWDRKSNYFYLPIGVNIDIPQDKGGLIAFNLEYDRFIDGYQRSTWGGDGNGFWNRQEDGYGLRGGMNFTMKTTKVDLYMEPFIRYWSIEQSRVQLAYINGSYGNWVEPKNSTIEIGSKFGLQF